MARSMLVISRQAPWSGPAAREALDVVLAGGAFELPLAMLFLDDGVLQLLAAQQPAAVEQKDLTANLQALPIFGVEQLYACAHSLQVRGLEQAPLGLPVQRLDAPSIRALLNRFDQVITL